ncbi:hypothetical protein Cgig2_000965 [Carnegiea gigantea]|uniref:Uncharacterized protein n=1 Tax=Carnegiea gigantea TaxID=171969 RepID=A0A9Q1QMR3_9CARY|nr:hypothetical protein Cgig2_000965 [Carnegiea gigantea]
MAKFYATAIPRRNLWYHPLKREKPRELLASRVRVSQSLSALPSMIDIYKLSTIEICWLSSKIEEIFGIVEIAVKIEDLVDVDRVKIFKASKLKVKEQEVLREEEQVRKMQENLTVQQQVLLEAEGKLKSSPDLKKKEAEYLKAAWSKQDSPSCRIWRRKKTISRV